MSYEECVRCGNRVPWVCFFGNAMLAVIKFFLGIASRSSALIADAVHSLADVIGTTGVIVSTKIARKPVDETHPYGYGKVEFFASVFIYFFLIIVAVAIIGGALIEIVNGKEEAPSSIAFGAAFISIMANVFMYRYSMCAGKVLKSPSLVANAYENLTDSCSSIAVVAGLTGAHFGYPVCDPLAAIVVAFFIFGASIKMFWDAVGGLIDKSLPRSTTARIYQIASSVDGVRGIGYIRARRVGRGIWIDIEIRVSPSISTLEGNRIAKEVRASLLRKSDHIKEAAVYFRALPSKKKSVPKAITV